MLREGSGSRDGEHNPMAPEICALALWPCLAHWASVPAPPSVPHGTADGTLLGNRVFAEMLVKVRSYQIGWPMAGVLIRKRSA